MSNQYPPPGSGQDPEDQPYPPPPPNEPQWNPQSPGTPPGYDTPQPPGQAPPGQGYGGPGYGQPPYGQPPSYPPPGAPGGYGGQPQQNSPLAIVSLTLGVLGFLCCPLFILGIAATVTGFLARKQIEESQGSLKGNGMAIAGLVIGITSIVLALLYWILALTGVLDSDLNLETG